MSTKVVVLLGMLCCVGTSIAHAQLKYSLKAGMNLSRVRHESRWDKKDYGSMTSFHVGVSATKDISKKFFLSGEFLFSDKGFNEGSAVHLLYASIPVMANFKMLKKFSMGVGPEFGILITPMGENDEFVKEVYSNRLDVGGSIDFQYTISPSFALSARFVQGFSNVIGREANVRYYGFDHQSGILLSSDLRDAGFVQKNQCFQLSICYVLRRKVATLAKG